MQLPAYLQNKASTRNLAAELLGNLGTGSPPSISIRNNKFTAIDATGEEKPIGGYSQQPDQFGAVGCFVDVVIADVNEHTSKVWFKKPFDPNGDWVPPDCWSDNGIGASRNATEPQSPLCGTCPKNVWGSAVSKVTGKGIKACHDVQKLAFIVPGDEMAYQFRVPPNSRTNLRDYMLKFKGQPFDIGDVVTRLWFDQQTIGTVLFAAVGFMDDATVALRDKALAEKKTDMLVGRGDMPVQQALPAPSNQTVTVPPGTPQNAQIPQNLPPAQPLPFVPPAATFVPPPAATSTPPTTPSASTTHTPAQSVGEPPRRRRRNAAPEQAPAPANGAAPAMAPFMPQQAAPTPPAAQPGNGAQFGIQQPAPANAEVTDMLKQVFGK